MLKPLLRVLDGRPEVVGTRLAYLLSGLRPDIADEAGPAPLFDLGVMARLSKRADGDRHR